MSPTLKVPATAESAIREVAGYLRAHPDSDATPCPCGAADDKQVTEVDRDGLPCPLWLCRACGVIRMDPQPSEATLAWFYTEAYRAIYGPHIEDPDAMFASKAWKGELVEAAIQRAGIEFTTGPIVDLGCGGGWVLEALEQLGMPLLGYDYDESLLDLGRGRGLTLKHGGTAQATEDGVQAELLIVAHVLEHTKDPVQHLRQLHPLVAPGGWLYLEVPHTRRIGTTLMGRSAAYWQRAHLWDFQRSHLETLARRAGWHPVHGTEDDLSVQVVCRAGEPDPELPLPRLGAEVEEQLRSHERLRRRLRTRALHAVRTGVRWARRCQRAFQPRC